MFGEWQLSEKFTEKTYFSSVERSTQVLCFRKWMKKNMYVAPSGLFIIYLLNWWLENFNQDCNLACHITFVVCVNIIHEWRWLQFNFDSKRQIWKSFHCSFVWSPIPVRKLTKEIYFSYSDLFQMFELNIV